MSNTLTNGPEFNCELNNYNTDFDAVCFLNCGCTSEDQENKDEDIIDASCIVESFDN